MKSMSKSKYLPIYVQLAMKWWRTFLEQYAPEKGSTLSPLNLSIFLTPISKRPKR